MRSGNSQYLAVLVCASCVACGNQQQANQPKSEPEPNTEQVPENPPQVNQPKSESEPNVAADQAPSSQKQGTADKPSDRGISEVCDQLTERAAQKCTKQVAGLYRASCRRYTKTPGKCEKEIFNALACQLKAADDSLCAHQADPNCAQANRELKTCERGTAPVEQTTAEDLTLPAGWAKINDSQLGFGVAMPRGAALDTKSKRRAWQAEENGITYVVAEVDPPAGKLNNAAILRTVTAYVGGRCQLRLKLHGELELKGTTVVQYDSGCTDGTEWHGMVHFWNGKAVSTGFHSPAGAKGVTEPYYYSFGVTHDRT